MTKADVSKVFAVFRLAYPTAEMFRASSAEELRRKLDATTTLWATCLEDIEPRVAEKASIEICKTLKFFPSIAEFREAAAEAARPPIEIIDAVELRRRLLAREARAAELKAKELEAKELEAKEERGLPEWERE